MDLANFARAVLALVFTLGLIGLGAVLARRYGPAAWLRVQPKTNRRLAVVESLTLDPARRLVLVRFDDQERLLLLGEGRMLAEGKAAPEASHGS